MAKRRIDITGQRFGMLTVIKEVEPKKYSRRWLCKCDCGNETVVYMSSLRSGNTKSCGCLQKEKASQRNFIDLTGKKFGKLTVLSRLGQSKSRKVLWNCRCECGNETVAESHKLLSGETKSCGCLRIHAGKKVQAYNEKNLVKDGVFTPLLKSKLRVDNQSGYKGVSIVKRKNKIKYQARICIKNKDIHLGYFDTIEEAIKARKIGEEKYHKPYLEENGYEGN